MFLLPVLLGPAYNYYDSNINEETDFSNSSEDIISPSIKGSTYNNDCQTFPKNGYCLNYHHIRFNSKDRDDGIIFKWKSSSSATNQLQNKNTTMNNQLEDPTNHNNEPIILLSGWLNKMKRRSKLYGDWNKRWVTLEHDCIVWRHGNNNHTATTTSNNNNNTCVDNFDKNNYYSSLSHKFSQQTNTRRRRGGRMELAHVDSILILKTHKKSSQKVFVIKSTYYRRNLCLMAKTSSDCEKWVRAIQLQMDLRSGGTSSGPASSKNHRNKSKNGWNGGDKFDNMIKNIDNHLSCLTQMEGSSKVLEQEEEETTTKECTNAIDETFVNMKHTNEVTKRNYPSSIIHDNYKYETNDETTTYILCENQQQLNEHEILVTNNTTTIPSPLSTFDPTSDTSSEIEEFIIQCNDTMDENELHHTSEQVGFSPPWLSPITCIETNHVKNDKNPNKSISLHHNEEEDEDDDIENLVVY